MTLGSFLMDLLDVIVPGDRALETLPAHFAGHGVDVAAVDLHHVELQRSVGEEIFATAGADVLHDGDPLHDLLALLVLPLVRVGVLQVGQEEGRSLITEFSTKIRRGVVRGIAGASSLMP